MIRNYTYILMILAASFWGCEPEINEPFEAFVIKAGKHNSVTRAQFLQSSTLKFNAIFNESAIYNSKDPINQHDTNKLMGFADCNVHHHVNSARFGWRWLNDQLEILAYCYFKNERQIKLVGVVELNQAYEYNITLHDNTYEFNLEGFSTVIMPRESKCKVGAYYMLFPYFGGDEVAPQDIEIKILTKNI